MRHGELRFDDHDDNSEHAEDESVITDAFPLLKQRLAFPEAVADVRLVVLVRRPAGRPCGEALLVVELLRTLRAVPPVLVVHPDQGDAHLLRSETHWWPCKGKH